MNLWAAALPDFSARVCRALNCAPLLGVRAGLNSLLLQRTANAAGVIALKYPLVHP
jgi:hypothetical protein